LYSKKIFENTYKTKVRQQEIVEKQNNGGAIFVKVSKLAGGRELLRRREQEAVYEVLLIISKFKYQISK